VDMVLATGFRNVHGGERQKITFDRCQFVNNTWDPDYEVSGAIMEVTQGHDDIVLNQCLFVNNTIGAPGDDIVRTKTCAFRYIASHHLGLGKSRQNSQQLNSCHQRLVLYWKCYHWDFFHPSWAGRRSRRGFQ